MHPVVHVQMLHMCRILSSSASLRLLIMSFKACTDGELLDKGLLRQRARNPDHSFRTVKVNAAISVSSSSLDILKHGVGSNCFINIFETRLMSPLHELGSIPLNLLHEHCHLKTTNCGGWHNQSCCNPGAVNSVGRMIRFCQGKCCICNH